MNGSANGDCKASIAATPAAAIGMERRRTGSGLGAGAQVAAIVASGLLANAVILRIWDAGDRGELVILAVFLASATSSIAGFAFSAI